MSDLLRQWVLSLDLSHLTQQQIEHLHALRNIAQKYALRDYLKQQGDLNP